MVDGQSIPKPDGSRAIKKSKDVDPDSLQNPSGGDIACRFKAGGLGGFCDHFY
jgi:hypothetical protein